MRKKITFFLLVLSLALNCWAADEQKLEVKAPGGMRVGRVEIPQSDQSLAAQLGTLVDSTNTKTWEDLNLRDLDEALFSKTQQHLINGCAIPHGISFPWDLFAPPTKKQLIEACRARRDLDLVRRENFPRDVFNQGLIRFGFVPQDGYSDDPGQDIRHYFNHLGMSIQDLTSFYITFGYKPKEIISKGRTKIDL